MWIISIISSASSFVESTLAQIYKVKDKTGFRGGPSYYMEKGLNKRWMGVLFSILITITFGLVFNSVQSNTVTIAFQNAFGTDKPNSRDNHGLCFRCDYLWWCTTYCKNG